MEPIVGVFDSRQAAADFAERVRFLGVERSKISVLTPGESAELHAEPTTDGEQPGMGAAIGGVVGGATGLSAGLAIVGTALIPGIGPVTALGATIVLALLGVLGGAKAGNALDQELEVGLPADELFVYEDALRLGRTVVFVHDQKRADEIRALLRESGAESVDAARDRWWVGLRDAAAEEYRNAGEDFGENEEAYRRGFEAALSPAVRGKTYEEAISYLAARYEAMYEQDAFRRGFARGRSYGAQRTADDRLATRLRGEDLHGRVG